MDNKFITFNLLRLSEEAIIKKIHCRHKIIKFQYDNNYYVIKKEYKNTKNLYKEYEILKSLSDDYVLKVYDYNEIENYYIMECMDGCLSELINNKSVNLSIYDKIEICNKIFDCLLYLENKKIVHLDFNYHNVLYRKINGEYIIKLSDFEFYCYENSKIIKDTIKPYMAYLYKNNKLILDSIKCVDMLYEGLTSIISKFLCDEFDLSIFIEKCKNKEFNTIKEAKEYFNDLI